MYKKDKILTILKRIEYIVVTSEKELEESDINSYEAIDECLKAIKKNDEEEIYLGHLQ